MINHKGNRLLETDRLILRGLTIKDAQLVFDNWTSDPDVAKFMRWNVHQSVEDTIQWMKFCESNKDNKEFYDWGIILKSTQEPIGSIGAFIHNDEPERYEVGYAISKKHWNKGYATEALKRIMEFLIHEVGMKKFIAVHSIENPASGVVLERNGFKYIRNGTYSSSDGKRQFICKVYYYDVD